jgi:phage tail sheath protein FI
MSVKKFKFVSPGVFLNEIDNSQLPKAPNAVGPTIIGRLEKGPGMIPLTVESMAQFVEVFGNPIPGGEGGDVWRDGNYTAPTYAAYAAQAFLRNSGPVNVVRLLGTQDPQATSGGEAGFTLAGTSNDGSEPQTATKSSAYGLYLFSTGGVDSRSTWKGNGNAARTQTNITGTLAAVWYFQQGAINLSGAVAHLDPAGVDRAASPASAGPGMNQGVTGSHVIIKSSDPSKMEFVAHLYDKGTNTTFNKVTFNFDRDSDKYIRKVFNTNPTLTNSGITQTAGLKKYWLGETFDRFVKDNHGLADIESVAEGLHKGALSGDASLCAAVVPLLKETVPFHDRRESSRDSVTGWVFSQDTNSDPSSFVVSDMQKLFKFVGISDGGSHTKDLKISITDLKVGTDARPYGTFTVLIRQVTDNDARPVVLERFSGCNLNPNSKNYIGAKIGDQYREWDEADKRYRLYGNHANQSKFFRVKMDQDVDAGVTDTQLLPFGFEGPIRYKSTTVDFGTAVTENGYISPKMQGLADPVADFDSSTLSFKPFGTSTSIAKHGLFGFPINSTASLIYPTLPLRLTASAEGLSNAKDSFFGVSTYRTPTDTRFDPSYVDVVRRLGNTYVSDIDSNPVADKSEVSFRFTLDDLILVHKTGSVKRHLGLSQGHITSDLVGTAVYAAGARRADKSYTAGHTGITELVKSGFAKFTMPVFGGFDGLDVTEKEAFRNAKMEGKDETTSYEIASLKRAIDAVADPEEIEMNVLTLPGITNTRVTNQAIRVCEERADALAIIDIQKGGYIPSTENKDDFKTNVQNSKVNAAVTSLESRGLNTSYACAFYPWVKIVDQISDSQVWVPPSVAALGTFGSTERESELWFAPAGFTRGGLSDGAAGVPVIAVSQRVSSKERDTLYEANINPIAQFPAEGIVVFGQKTLQVTPSALDRINVRRLMIFVKKEISRIAARLLFDQNVQATWDRFRGQVEPFLDSVKSRFGLSDFRVILDDTTTTPDLIDRNIMYAKIFLKPARAIEFIAIDFVITNTGASFED